jgi:hypothetical protein
MIKLIRVLLKIVGFALILVGLVAAYYGPLEIFVFYLFSEGGRFHYDGFGVGSIWFAALVVQNIGYYVIAAICIPIGIGHLKLRRWALTLTQLYIWFWLGAGILLAANLIALIPQTFNLELSQDQLITRLAIIGVFTFFSLILLPVLTLWFYRNKKVSSLFWENDPYTYWTENFPFPLLALLLLYVIMIIVLHTAIFLQSLFPVFGQIIFGRQSVYLISLCILILGILTVGIIQLKDWAWWGSLVYLSLLSVSSLISFSQHSFYEIIQMMSLPTFEKELLEELTLVHDFYLVGLVAAPLLAALGLLIYSKRYFIS